MNTVMDVKKERSMYDAELLSSIDEEKYLSKYSLSISALNPGPGLKIRPLKSSDYDRGFLELLKQLTKVGDVSEEEFQERFSLMLSCSNSYYVTVIEDTCEDKIVGTGTLVVEQKFIHKCGTRGKIEDVVVSEAYRGRQLGKLLIATLTLLAEQLNCYKASLECVDSNVPFYESLRFRREPGNANLLQLRFSS